MKHQDASQPGGTPDKSAAPARGGFRRLLGMLRLSARRAADQAGKNEAAQHRGPHDQHDGRAAHNGRKHLGAAGELAAAAHLKKHGCKILKRNYTCKRGEVDIIALDGRTVCFIEVKTRRPDPLFAPRRTVTAGKRRKIRAVAKYYLRSNNLMDRVCRFDIVCVIYPEGGKPEVELLKHAF